MYSIAFGTHTKMAEPIGMPFGRTSGVGTRNSVLRWGDDPRRERGVRSLLREGIQPTLCIQCATRRGGEIVRCM